MNARKGLCGVCAVVVGLSLVLQGVALAAPPSLARVGEMPIYGPEGAPAILKVSIPQYHAGDSMMPSFLHGWSSASEAEPNLDPLWHYPLDNNVAPDVQVPTLEQSGSSVMWY